MCVALLPAFEHPCVTHALLLFALLRRPHMPDILLLIFIDAHRLQSGWCANTSCVS